MYDLQLRVDCLDQAEMMSLQYYFALTTLWQNIDHQTDYTLVCPTNNTTFQKFINRQLIFKPLAGLQDEYDRRILNIDPVPSLK